jgi:exopolysaccharide biosynthesis polyprenyl glycosylphosphotransferase
MAAQPMQSQTGDALEGSTPGLLGADQLQLVLAHSGAEHPNGSGLRPRVGDALRRYQAISMGLAVTDAACILAALMISYQMRYSMARPMPARELAVVLVAPLLWVAAFQAFNLYAPQHLSPSEEFRGIIGATSLGIVVVVMASYWSKSSFPRAWLGLSWLLALLLELATRRAWESYRLRLKRDGRLAFRTLIVGTTGEATRLAENLKDPTSGFTPIGYVGADPPAPTNGLAVLGDIHDLRQLVREHHADCFFVASTSVSIDDMFQVTQVARRERTEVRVSANVSQTLTSRLTLQKVGEAIALSIRPVRLTRAQVAMKRAFDLLMASAALVVSLPLWAVIAIAIRLSSQGPVFFHQVRVTKGGRIFRMHKFRTMKVDVDSPVDTSTPFFKLQSDPRLTPVGGVIRRLSLDELPQFWNVLKGEMSLVGPRPLPADQVAANLELLSPRHEVPAGVTGWWQINGRSGVTPEEATHLDQFYIENWSLSLDLYILLKTFGAVLGQKGAQ